MITFTYYYLPRVLSTYFVKIFSNLRKQLKTTSKKLLPYAVFSTHTGEAFMVWNSFSHIYIFILEC